jgi:hypothetical protein
MCAPMAGERVLVRNFYEGLEFYERFIKAFV